MRKKSSKTNIKIIFHLLKQIKFSILMNFAEIFQYLSVFHAFSHNHHNFYQKLSKSDKKWPKKPNFRSKNGILWFEHEQYIKYGPLALKTTILEFSKKTNFFDLQKFLTKKFVFKKGSFWGLEVIFRLKNNILRNTLSPSKYGR